MSEFDKFWMELVKAQPRLLEGSERITFTVTGFRKILEQAFLEGRKTATGSKFGVSIDNFLQGIDE